MWRYPSIRITVLILALACLGSLDAGAQSMIGLKKEEVRELIKQEHKAFRRDQTVVNQKFNYLKYVNGLKTRTWILYFDDKDRCKTTKLVCDYNEFDEVLEELNDAYERTGDMKWEYKEGKDLIEVSMSKQEWYFTVREARRK